MKAKLVKYPYDEKKYRWDTWAQGKEFQYFWDESLPKNYTTIEPYIKIGLTGADGYYGYIDLTKDPNTIGFNDDTIVNKYHTSQSDISSKKVKSNFYITDRYNITNCVENYYQVRYFTQRTNYLLTPYEYYSGARDVPAGAISTEKYCEIKYVYKEENGIIKIKPAPKVMEDRGGTYFNYSRYGSFIWRNTTNNTYDWTNQADRDAIALLIKAERGWTSNIQWEINNVTSEFNGLYYVCGNYNKNNLPYTYTESGDTWPVYRYNNMRYEDTYYVLNSNAASQFSNFEYYGFAKNIQTETQQLYKRVPDKDINNPSCVSFPIIRGDGLFPNDLFDYIYDNPSTDNDNYVIKYILKNYPHALDCDETQNSTTIAGTLTCFATVKGSDLSFNLKVARLLDGNTKYMAVYNSNQTFLKNYRLVTRDFGQMNNGGWSNVRDISYNGTRGMGALCRYNYQAENVNHPNQPKWDLVDVPFSYQDDRFLQGWKGNYREIVPNYYHTSWNDSYGRDYKYGPVIKSITVDTYMDTEYVYKFGNEQIYPLRCFEEENGNVYVSFVRIEENKSNIPSSAYQTFCYFNYYYLNQTNTSKRMLVKIEDWIDLVGNDYINYELKNLNGVYGEYYMLPDITLIGDTTDDIAYIQEGTTKLSYTIGTAQNNQFVPKPIQYNAPCEYSNGSVSSRTWLTLNSYSAQEWNNGFHFLGNQWNNIGSPFAYLSNITSSSGSREMMFNFQVCQEGIYKNLFKLINGGFVVDDNNSNHYIASTDTSTTYKHYFTDNLGGLWYFGTGSVSSIDRNAYPDNGTQDGYAYKLRPEDTTFLRYYRTRDELVNVEMFSDRYHYTHDTVDFCDRSYEGTVCGTPTSTGEETIPDGTWREYLGLYLGESIPFLHITETVVPPSEILGVPQYDKQVNTSDTLKYGTVASASLSFTLNKPVNDCMALNNQLLVLFYDFKNTDEWERLGFFRVDNIEALDEYSTSLLAHDETYKLNKYVDTFLEDYTQSTTLDLFYRDLLDYCGCFYDTHQPTIHNGNISMSNVYHAVKTTGIQVAHYIAILAPGFIHTNIDGDIVLSQYQIVDNNLTISDYTNLVYCAYNTDMINKVKITSNNAVKGESAGSGENVYFLADDPLLSELQSTSYFNDLADGILAYYSTIPAYRPATIDFLILPRSLAIGDIVNLTTPKNENYAVIIMRMSITSSGVQVQSFGTQQYPVEAESNSEFVNLINDMGEISGDVSNMMEAQRTMANAIADNAANINQNSTDISTIITKNTEQDTTLNSHTSAITTLQGYKSTTSNNLATIILSNTLNNVALKGYVDAGNTSTLNSAKAYADGLIGTSLSFRTGTIRWSNTSSAQTFKTCHCIFIGTNDKRNGLFIPTEFIDADYNKTILFRVYNGTYFACRTDTSDVGWFAAYSVTFTED